MSRSRSAHAHLITLAGIALATACGHAQPAPDARPGAAECQTADVERMLASQPTAQVIVLLNGNADTGAQLLRDLSGDFQLARSYANLPGFSGTITRNGYERARGHAAVRCIQLDRPGSGGG